MHPVVLPHKAVYEEHILLGYGALYLRDYSEIHSAAI
jgi:hypothetical protein